MNHSAAVAPATAVVPATTAAVALAVAPPSLATRRRRATDRDAEHVAGEELADEVRLVRDRHAEERRRLADVVERLVRPRPSDARERHVVGRLDGEVVGGSPLARAQALQRGQPVQGEDEIAARSLDALV